MHCKTFHFKFCAEGELPMDTVATFTVSVAQEVPPTLTLTPDGGALPEETVGVAVSDVVTVVSGGQPPYTFALSAGATPDGTELSSETNTDGTETITIDGTPTTAGDFSFDLDVTDSATPPVTAKVRGVVKAAPAAKKPVAARKR